MNTLRSLVAALACAFVVDFAPAAELAPSWTLVPEETVLVVRLPGGAAFVDALRRQTKLGAVVLSQERLQRVMDLVQQEGKERWNEMVRDLAKYNLKPDDWLELYRGEAGFALVVRPRPARDPLLVGLAWLEPGQDLSERIVRAVQTAVEDQPDKEHPVRRVDLELVGHEVMHLTVPQVGSDVEAGFTFPEDFEELTPEKLQQLQEEQQRKLADAKQIEVDRINVFITRLGNRLLVASTFAQSSDEVRALAADPTQKLDFAEVTGVEEATGVFARFLAAHAGRTRGSPRFLDTPGLVAALPDGVPLVEIVGDPEPLWKLAAAADDPMLPRMLHALGVDAIGPVAIRATLEGNLLRHGLFLAAPAPRRGLLTLLDQQELAPDPPAWVPSNIVDFQQISFDLGKAYTRVKELVVGELGETARPVFEEAETRVKTALGTDIASLLSSLGHEHSAVTFPPKTGGAAPAAGNPLAAGGEMALTGFTQRVGMVWQVSDEKAWKTLLQVIATSPLAALGGLRSVEEQGFTGVRLQQQPVEVGLFVGRGYLVLGIGSQVSESLLATVRNPPRGQAALGSSTLFQRAREVLPLRPCLGYQVGDASSTAKTLKQLFVSGFDRILEAPPRFPQDPDDPAGGVADSTVARAVADKIKQLFPTDEELDGLMGVSVGLTVVNSHGLVSQSVLELPPP